MVWVARMPAGHGEWIFHGGQQAGAEGVLADPTGPQIGRRIQRNRLFAGSAIFVRDPRQYYVALHPL